MKKYTTQRWLKLTQIIELTANKQISAVELRKYCDDMGEWEFIADRLTKLGMIYFKDLNATYNEIMTSSDLAKNIYDARGDFTGYEAEMELLNAPVNCVAGLPVKCEPISDIGIDFIENLPEPDFYLGSTFVRNDLGEPVLFLLQ